MRILLVGAHGTLGRAVAEALSHHEVIAASRSGGERVDLDDIHRLDRAVRLRNDDAAWRIAIHPADVDDVAYLGWSTGDAAGFDAATTFWIAQPIALVSGTDGAFPAMSASTASRR